MGRLSIIIAGCGSFLVLGSVVALAQAVPPDGSIESASSAPAVSPSPAVAEEVPSSAQASEAPTSVEDAPIEVPSSTQSDWAPDINLDVPGGPAADVSSPKRKVKPRKVLSDAGENALGTGSWSSSNNSDATQAQLLARANRRERAIDPIKRSELTKLSRVMGALHALRVSCSGRDDQTYRSRMATMLDLEAPDSGELRDPLVDAFNGGFQAYGRGAGACPADARLQEASLAKDGYVIARSMTVRYRPVPAVQAVLPPATQPRQNASPHAVAKEKAPLAKAAPERSTWNNQTSN